MIGMSQTVLYLHCRKDLNGCGAIAKAMENVRGDRLEYGTDGNNPENHTIIILCPNCKKPLQELTEFATLNIEDIIAGTWESFWDEMSSLKIDRWIEIPRVSQIRR